MTPPNKCEAVRRASIICTDLKELDELSDEATILFKRFDETRWHWFVVVEHDILPLISPGQVHVAYQSVKTFNRMIEQGIAKAIAGETAEEGFHNAAATAWTSTQLGSTAGSSVGYGVGQQLTGGTVNTSLSGLAPPSWSVTS